MRCANRPGLSLIEVLMAILVMGIGVLSVISLFPIAFVRAISATNLTNATILRHNAESRIDLDPLNLLYIYPTWRPDAAYTAGSIVLSRESAAGNNHSFIAQAAGVSGPGEPQWILGGNTVDRSIVWIDRGAHDRYAIDPMGAIYVGPGMPLGINPPAGLTAMPRFGGASAGGNFASIDAAATIASSPDSWVQQARLPVYNFTLNSVTLNGTDQNGDDLAGIAANIFPSAPSVLTRIVMFDASRKSSQTRLITQLDRLSSPPAPGHPLPVASWVSADPIVGGFTPSEARIESRAQRYTWLATVRRDVNGVPNVDIVVFFNRSFTSDDEQIFSATDGGATFTVPYTSPKPFAKRGGFVLDATIGRWYRITSINDDGALLRLTFDKPRPAAESQAAPTFAAIFMRGVIDVFPMQ